MVESEVIVDNSSLATNIDYLAKMGGRKYTLSIIVVLLATLLCWFGKINEGILSVIFVTVITAFSVANVSQKISSK